MNVFRHKMRYAWMIGLGTLALAPLIASAAWTGPTQAPTGGNVAAPINVGTTDQVKNGGLGVSSLAVFGNSLFGGSTGSNAYLNFGATVGEQGYGIRDNAGLLEFKNSGGAWESIQSIVFNLVGGSGAGSGSITGTLLYPDGPNGTPITKAIVPSNPNRNSYTVPAGKTLYITGIYPPSNGSGYIEVYIDDIRVAASYVGSSATYTFYAPVIVGAGSRVDGGLYYSMNFNGFLADASGS